MTAIKTVCKVIVSVASLHCIPEKSSYWIIRLSLTPTLYIGHEKLYISTSLKQMIVLR
jgi:hypothetical protein